MRSRLLIGVGEGEIAISMRAWIDLLLLVYTESVHVTFTIHLTDLFSTSTMTENEQGFFNYLPYIKVQQQKPV